MDKIVIMTSKPVPDYRLLELASTAFPDCDIHIVTSTIDALDEATTGSPFVSLLKVVDQVLFLLCSLQGGSLASFSTPGSSSNCLQPGRHKRMRVSPCSKGVYSQAKSKLCLTVQH